MNDLNIICMHNYNFYSMLLHRTLPWLRLLSAIAIRCGLHLHHRGICRRRQRGLPRRSWASECVLASECWPASDVTHPLRQTRHWSLPHGLLVTSFSSSVLWSYFSMCSTSPNSFLWWVSACTVQSLSKSTCLGFHSGVCFAADSSPSKAWCNRINFEELHLNAVYLVALSIFSIVFCILKESGTHGPLR